MSARDDAPSDDEVGPQGHDLVRPYVMTGGRTRAERRGLHPDTVLTAVEGASGDGWSAEHAALLRCCERPTSIAGASAELGLVPAVTTILAGDLVAEGLLDVHQHDPVEVELEALARLVEANRTS